MTISLAAGFHPGAVHGGIAGRLFMSSP